MIGDDPEADRGEPERSSILWRHHEAVLQKAFEKLLEDEEGENGSTMESLEILSNAWNIDDGANQRLPLAVVTCFCSRRS